MRDGFPSALMETKINDATGGAKEKTIIREPWMDGQTDCLLHGHVAAFGRPVGYSDLSEGEKGEMIDTKIYIRV